MSIINWTYGVPMSGLQFPMVTASGPYAQGYDVTQISGVISKDGGAFAALGSRIASVGQGVYNITSLSSTEMTCYTWFIKVTANSGCIEQGLLGINTSSTVTLAPVTHTGATIPMVTTVNNVSGNVQLNAAVHTSAQIPVVTEARNVSGTVILAGVTHVGATIPVVTTVGNVSGTVVLTSGYHSGATIWSVTNVDVSGIARQVWNTATNTATSAPTFGGSVSVSGGYTTLTAASVTAVHDEVIEGSMTERQLLRVLLSVLGGKSAGGGGTNITFRDLADTKNRINATVDANGNRTAISVDGT